MASSNVHDEKTLCCLPHWWTSCSGSLHCLCQVATVTSICPGKITNPHLQLLLGGGRSSNRSFWTEQPEDLKESVHGSKYGCLSQETSGFSNKGKNEEIWLTGTLILMFVSRKPHAQKRKRCHFFACFVLCMWNILIACAYMQLLYRTIYCSYFCDIGWLVDFVSCLSHTSVAVPQRHCNLGLEEHRYLMKVHAWLLCEDTSQCTQRHPRLLHFRAVDFGDLLCSYLQNQHFKDKYIPVVTSQAVSPSFVTSDRNFTRKKRPWKGHLNITLALQ